MMEIKQSTAARDLVFYMVATSDGYTPITGLTPTVTISKNGGAFASPSGAVTEISGGFYKVAGNATDSNTLGILALKATGSGAVPVAMAYHVVANLESDTYERIGVPGATDIANDIDALSIQVSALQNLSAAEVRTELATELARIDVAISSRNSTTPPSASTVAGAVRTELTTELGRIDAAISSRNSTTPPTAAAIADAVWDEATAGHVAAGSTGAAIVAAGSAGDPWSSSLPGAYGAGTAGHIIGNNLATAAPTSAAIADAVWDEATSGHVAAGSTGAAIVAAGSAGDPWSSSLPGAYGAGTAGHIIGNRIDAAISSRSSHTAAQVWTAASRTLTAQSDSSGITTLLTRLPGAITLSSGKVTVGTNDDKSGYALATAPPTAAAIADAVWDEPTAGHVAAGSTGAAIIAAAAGGGGSGATPAEIADAVWDEALSGHVIAGSAGAGLAAASASGDPWATPLPGIYAAGTAGAGIGRLNLVPGDGPVIVIPDPSDDPGQCVIYVSTRDIDGTITPGVRIRITPRNGPATTAGGQLVGMTPFDLITDADGFASAVLERVDLLTPANTLYYQVTATRYALDTTISPTTALFDLASIIVP